MKTPLRVLILEDSEEDTALLVLSLRRGGYLPVWERVETAAGLAASIERQSWDVILAAYVMARLTARDAHAVLRGRGLDLPFIVVSSKTGEETAVEAMKDGAHDYILKQNLVRLVPAVERELREAASRAARQRAETALRRLGKAVDTVDIGITVTDLEGRIIYTNPAEARMHGYTTDELVGIGAHVLAPLGIVEKRNALARDEGADLLDTALSARALEALYLRQVRAKRVFSLPAN